MFNPNLSLSSDQCIFIGMTFCCHKTLPQLHTVIHVDSQQSFCIFMSLLTVYSEKMIGNEGEIEIGKQKVPHQTTCNITVHLL